MGKKGLKDLLKCKIIKARKEIKFSIFQVIIKITSRIIRRKVIRHWLKKHYFICIDFNQLILINIIKYIGLKTGYLY